MKLLQSPARKDKETQKKQQAADCKRPCSRGRISLREEPELPWILFNPIPNRWRGIQEPSVTPKKSLPVKGLQSETYIGRPSSAKRGGKKGSLRDGTFSWTKKSITGRKKTGGFGRYHFSMHKGGKDPKHHRQPTNKLGGSGFGVGTGGAKRKRC